MTDNAKNNKNDPKALDAGDDQKSLEPGDDLALQALSDASASDAKSSSKDELSESNELAETLTSLQNVVERNAEELESLKKQLTEKREMLRNVFENDAELSAAEEQVQTYSSQLKERKSKMQSDPQVTALKVQIGEINEQKKEIEEALSNHLVNYYSLTNSTSFDTSDGDQWDFTVRAKVKPRRNK